MYVILLVRAFLLHNAQTHVKLMGMNAILGISAESALIAAHAARDLNATQQDNVMLSVVMG